MRTRWGLVFSLAAACACGGGSAGSDAAADPGGEPGPGDVATPDADIDAADAGNDVSDVGPADIPADATSDIDPIVAPPCDPATLSGKGAAVPIADLARPPSESMPFPNLAMARADAGSATGLRLRFNDHLMAPLLNLLDGTGTSSPFVVPLEGPPDPDSLPDPAAAPLGNDAVFLVRTADADVPGLDPQRLADARVPIRAAFNPDAVALVVEPTVPLDERTRYALVVTRCLRDADGRPVGRAPTMDLPLEPDTPLADETARALRFLGRPDVNVPADTVALVLPAVTRTARGRLIAAARASDGLDFQPEIEWAMAPALEDGTLDPAFLERLPGLEALIDEQFPPDAIDGYDFAAVALVAQGTFKARRWCDPVEGMRFGPDGAPRPFDEDLTLRFFLTLPREDVAAGRAQPFPLVLFQHAFGVCKETAIALAGTFSRMGLATLGIDAVAHGHRAEGGTWRCPIDPTSFLTIGEPVRLWYNFAESAIDLAQLAAMARGLDLDLLPAPGGDGVPDLRTDRFGVIGQSMGAFLAADLLGLDDRVGPAVINVGGGHEALFFAWGLMGGTQEQSLTHGFATLSALALDIMVPTQAAMDDVEPLVLAGGAGTWPAGRHVLLQQAVEDRTVPMACGHRLALRMGLARMASDFPDLPGLPSIAAPVQGNLPGGRTGVLTQFSPAKHEFLLINDWADRDPLLLFRGQVQAGLFLRDGLGDDAPAAIDPYLDEKIVPWIP